MTQMEISKTLGISFLTINRYENEKHFPTPIVLNAIQSFFDSKGIAFAFHSEMEADSEHGDEIKQV